MPDVYGRDYAFGTVISGDLITIDIGNTPTGLIVQSIRYNYPRQIGSMWNLLDQNYYLVVGRPRGQQLTMNGVIGQSSDYQTFIDTFTDPCQAYDKIISISITTGCGVNQETHTVRIHSPLIASIGEQVTVENFVYTSALQFTFGFMDYGGSTTTAAP